MIFNKEEFTRGLNARRAPLVSAKSTAVPEDAGQDAIEQQARAKWRTDAAIREEFLSEATYTAYCQAVSAGRVRLLTNAPGLIRTSAPQSVGTEVNHGN